MKIFLSAIEGQDNVPKKIVKEYGKMKYNLMSFYAIKGRNVDNALYIRNHIFKGEF